MNHVRSRRFWIGRLTLPVPEDCRLEYLSELYAVNRRRIKAATLTFLFAGWMMLGVLIILERVDPAGLARLQFLRGLLLALGLIPQFLPMLERKSVSVNRLWWIQAVQLLYIYVLLLWCTDIFGTGLQLLDRLLMFQIGILFIAPVLILAHRVTLLFFPAIQVLGLVILFPSFLAADISSLPAFALAFFGMVVAILLSVVRYRLWLKEFLLLVKLRHKVEQLRREKADLEQTNLLLERMTQIDSLTGIFNRFMFDKTIQREWQRCKRHKVPLSLLMIDIDSFKAYNDHYGHPAGDECIRIVAETLSGAVKRSSDLAARYGGDEFAVILPYMDWEEAACLARSLKKRIELLRVLHAFSPFSESVSISVGVHSEIPCEGRSLQDFIKVADDALYAMKKQRLVRERSSQTAALGIAKR